MKILIIQTAFTGDVILATPLIEKLHRFYPVASIDFLLRKGNEGLLTGHPFLNEIITWDKKKNKRKNLFSIISKVQKQKYDLVVNAHRFASSGLITALSGAKTTIGFDKNPLSYLFSKRVKHVIGDGTHEVQRNLNLITDITDDSFFVPKLYPLAKDYASVHNYKGKPYVCIAPTSVWFTKQWPKEKWVELIPMLLPNKIYLIGGPDDFYTCEEIKNAITIPKTSDGELALIENLSGELTLLQSAALIKDAKMNFVNDSAPLHMASAMNAPVTAVFCSTVPDFGFGPLSDHAKVVETTVRLNCRPCGLHGYKTCPEGHFKCALTIKPEELKIHKLHDYVVKPLAQPPTKKRGRKSTSSTKKPSYPAKKRARKTPGTEEL